MVDMSRLAALVVRVEEVGEEDWTNLAVVAGNVKNLHFEFGLKFLIDQCGDYPFMPVVKKMRADDHPIVSI